MFAQGTQLHSAVGETVRSLKGKVLSLLANTHTVKKRLGSSNAWSTAPTSAGAGNSTLSTTGSGVANTGNTTTFTHAHAHTHTHTQAAVSVAAALPSILGTLPTLPSGFEHHIITHLFAPRTGVSPSSKGVPLPKETLSALPQLAESHSPLPPLRLPSPHTSSKPFRLFGLAQKTVSSPFARVRATSLPSALTESRRFFFTRDSSSVDEEELEELFESANNSPRDARKQAQLLELLCRADPEAAVKRVESKQFATSTNECMRYYLTALVESGLIYKRDLTRLEPLVEAIFRNPQSSLGAGRSSWLESASTSASGSGFSTFDKSPSLGSSSSSSNPPYANVPWLPVPSSGSEHSPIHVVMQEPSPKSQMWRLIRTFILLMLVFFIVSQFVEERGFPGRVGPAGQEIQPEQFHHYTFEDVQGADEAKEELQDVVEFLRNPTKFTRLGGKLPKGILLVGPPGTGKTLLAKAVAGEAGVPFFYCSGSEFDEMLVGVGARRIRELFAAAKKKAPCIIFMDEIDAVGSKRTSRDQAYSHMTLNQLLVELDGFKGSENVIIIAATNFPETLDPALVRPGRFDTHINVPLPDVRGRESILKAHTRSIPLDNPEDLWKLARGTPGFSGAELANIVNQASLKASREQRDAVTLADLEWAKDKVAMGAERKKAVITESDRKVTAYHEGGHALCALFTEGATPVYKATIVPRGMALGMVTQLPEDDTNSVTKKEMMARLIVCMGGRVAEEKIFGKDHVTSGASSDIEQATKLARAMVTRYGMSEKVGPILLQEEENMGDATRALIESEIKAILMDAYNQARSLLTRYEKEHHLLAKALLEHETLTADEMRAVIAGKQLPIH